MILKALAIILILQISIENNFQKKTKQSITASFKRFDIDGDAFLDEQQLELYFKRDYLKQFEGIDIDKKFIDGAFQFLKDSDVDGNGIQLKQFLVALLPDQTPGKKYEPNYYPEQQL